MNVHQLRDMVADLAHTLFPEMRRLPTVSIHSEGDNLGQYTPATNHLSLHENLCRLYPVSEIAATVIHELAHAQTHGEQEIHGAAWAKQMTRCGVDPRTHHIAQFGKLAWWLVRRR
jgi:predicted SprT family Zn-dependent metalloprotease